MRLVFLYDDYVKGNLTGPILAILFFGILIIGNLKPLLAIIKSLFEAINSHEKYAVGDIIEKYIINIVLMIFSVFFISINISPLISGGMYLFSEKETDAIYTEGKIESIEQLNQYSSPKYQTDYGTTYGIKVNISGNIYNIITIGKFEIGDSVKIKYLPKSKFILEMYTN